MLGALHGGDVPEVWRFAEAHGVAGSGCRRTRDSGPSTWSSPSNGPYLWGVYSL